jgi:hypothetical protein
MIMEIVDHPSSTVGTAADWLGRCEVRQTVW